MKFSNLLKNNPEQLACYELALSRSSLVVEALAGTGKTTIVKIIATEFAEQGKRVLYLAFNRAVVEEVKADARGVYDCHTAHGLALKNVGPDVFEKFQKTKDRFLLDRDLKRLLNIDSRLECPDVRIDEKEFRHELEILLATKKERRDGNFINIGQIKASVLLDSIVYLFTLYRKSVDYQLTREFVEQNLRESMEWPWSEAGFPESEVLIDYIWNKTLEYWNRTVDLRDEEFPLDHDSYLKIWQISHPTLDYDVILFDEAQDADPVMVQIVERQSAIKLWVGDSQQQIYSWRGAVNTLANVTGDSIASLTVTQRFGTPIDLIANAFLAPLGAQLIKPSESVSSSVEYLRPLSTTEMQQAAPVKLELFRTNLSLMHRFMALVNQGVAVQVLADLEVLLRRLNGLIDVARGDEPEFAPFVHFLDLEDLVKYVNGQTIRSRKNTYSQQPSWYPDILLLLRLGGLVFADGILEYRPVDEQMILSWERLIEAIERAKNSKETAGCTLATAHKAKGLSSDEVWVHDCFCKSSLYKNPQSIDEAIALMSSVYKSDNKLEIAKFTEEQRLCYVAVTRAKGRLIHHFPISDYINCNEDFRFAPIANVRHTEVSTLSSPGIDVENETVDSDAALPEWSNELCRVLDSSNASVVKPKLMYFRIRFNGWTNLAGKLEPFGFDITVNSSNKPTTLSEWFGPNELLKIVEIFVNPFIPKVGEMPALTLATEQMLEVARVHCSENGVTLKWLNGPHPYIVSLWDELQPREIVRLPFGKKGLTLGHLSGYDGDHAKCIGLIELIKRGLLQ